ncbi:Cof-type HAD-IIB family hydrolase [Bacillota bacterium LX-D]|nr:Cof-type HAD-IIB family hydrolase [Bacillota bacterium LX-D]
MKYKLIAIDIDGTLLTDNLYIEQETIDNIRQATARNVLVTLSTGRVYNSALPFAQKLQLDVPLITCNGAVIKGAKTATKYYEKTIAESCALEVIDYCQANSLDISIYRQDEIFIDEKSINWEIHTYRDWTTPQILTGQEQFQDSIIKFLINAADKQKLAEHSRKLAELFQKDLNFYFYLPDFVEVYAKEATKKNALQFLAAKFNIKREEIIAIGDNYNDLDMIEYAGLGVAMGNSPSELKNIADFVTYSNHENGVNYIFKTFVLQP